MFWFVDEEEDYNHYTTAGMLFWGLGLTSEQKGRRLERYKAKGIITPVGGPKGLLFSGETIAGLLRHREQRAERRNRRDTQRLLSLMAGVVKDVGEIKAALGRKQPKKERGK